VFLLHLRSALRRHRHAAARRAGAFIVMHYQGVNANIMSLGGIAIAIGAMVDAAVVMIENAHKKLEAGSTRSGASCGRALDGDAEAAARSAGAVLLAAHHHAFLRAGVRAAGAGGRLFSPLAYHQDLRHGGGGALSVTLVPVLMGYLIRGRIPRETAIRSTGF
jgi:Cu(I)/Ag(I) efflux system membrane protein CusA/SilA